jgi:hypothetical protein
MKQFTQEHAKRLLVYAGVDVLVNEVEGGVLREMRRHCRLHVVFVWEGKKEVFIFI